MTRIEDYALIGDLRTAALVGRDGSIDWCCLPRFDSGACFAALLGGSENGRWLLAPAAPSSVTRRYRPGTLVLETVHETTGGSVRVLDFMPPHAAAPTVVRIIEGLEGEVAVRSELVMRFDYGRVLPWVRRINRALVAIAGPDGLCLRTSAEVRGEGMHSVSDLVVRSGERVPFVLSWFPSHAGPPLRIDPEQALRETEAYWLDWSRSCHYSGAYGEEVRGSLLVLKALTHAQTGGMVAAPTTSLPEQIGGIRNWDYRFCWLRDTPLALLAMLRTGYRDEAEAWERWLLRAVAGDPADVQIMYGLGGERRLDEQELDWLPGYEESGPVRVGNAACTQLQLDVYGEVLDAIYHSRLHGIRVGSGVWPLCRRLLAWLEEGWRRPDAGLWEVRGPDRHFTHSKVMAWVAFDRAIRLNAEYGVPGPVARWRRIRDEISAEIHARAWNVDKQAYAQSYDAGELDASVLLMPAVGFIDASDPRFVSTVEAIQRELLVDGLVRRYRVAEGVDGLPGDEGVFLACSFWLAEVFALQGRAREARALFQRLLALRNDVGLLSEEYDPAAGRQLGNFPQAFSHLALVSAALAIGEEGSLRHPDDPWPDD